MNSGMWVWSRVGEGELKSYVGVCNESKEESCDYGLVPARGQTLPRWTKRIVSENESG